MPFISYIKRGISQTNFIFDHLTNARQFDQCTEAVRTGDISKDNVTYLAI